MSPFTLLSTALSSLGANKMRTTLTLLGVVIGVAAVISLMSIGRGAQQAITANIQALGTNLLFVQPGSVSQSGVAGGVGSAQTLTLQDAYALVDPVTAPSVSAVAPELRTTTQVVAGRTNTRTQVVGVTPEFSEVRNFPVAAGHFISMGHVETIADVAVLGARVAETLFDFRNPIGQEIRINGRPFTVIGVLHAKGGTAMGITDDVVFVPITTASYRLGAQRTAQGEVSVQSINVQAVSARAMDSAVQEIATILRLRHRVTDEDDFVITSQRETIETLEATSNVFVVFLGSIAGISLLVGGIGIMNIMLVSVTERTREIGVRKAMGAKSRDVLFQFSSEATLLSLGGGLIGLALGLGLSRVLDGASLGNQVLRTAFAPDIAVLALVVSAAIGLFFGIYPAMRAARLQPVEALRYQ